MLPKDYAAQDCSIARGLELVGERWTLLLLRDAFYGVCRYSDFRERLDIPKAVLAARLAALVDSGVMEKRPAPDGAGTRHEYVLTDLGKQLWPAVVALGRFGERAAPNAEGPRKHFRHLDCGGRLDAFCRCERCGATVENPADAEVVPGPGDRNAREDRISRALRAPHRLLTPIA
ncbi:hypothetical protein BIV57_16610 [Mangrovactinospora gilvigrisea]|uniref:HTH hxlR-type domain-containing protein n=1 Tax=Mangrovactinospora gilvigrisea TaxID=1428644 RepID=A0A1J7BSE3_9ACTN|nr:helix-turn-helix domain-containing protein [Mangrovactinospora gilvigrisea]OIV36377.1 hypothetical protein BIV57_16610 [Mangrovactinospora gilvigrisea]